MREGPSRRHRTFAWGAWGAALLCALALPAHAAPKRAKKDTTAPVVEHTPVMTHDGKGPVVITATIRDDSAVFEPTLVVRAAGPGPFMRVPLVPGDSGAYAAEVPAALLASDVEYLVEAFDENGNGPSRVGDEQAPLLIKREVPAPAVAPVAPVAAPPVEEDGAGTGLVVAGVVVGTVLLVGAAAGVGFAVYALRPPAVESVRIGVSGPAPVATVAP